MLIHDDIFAWEGFGGMLELASGRCRLRIFDLNRSKENPVMHIKPIVTVVSDLPGHESRPQNLSVRSCTSHIATSVVRQFDIDPQRMVFLEYYPPSTYGDKQQHHIPAKFDVVDFVWHDNKALHPKWRVLRPPLLDVISELIERTQ
ncbi:MAG: hypothetical protein PVI54_07035 [Desulfobacteraceae bacterium]|jgi:hypothetical protein